MVWGFVLFWSLFFFFFTVIDNEIWPENETVLWEWL